MKDFQLKMSGDESNKNYLKLIVFIFLAFGSFIVAVTSGFFAVSGLYYGEGVYETKVLTNADMYTCTANCGTATATYNTSAPITSYTQYQTTRDLINSKITSYLTATAIAFSLLTLVFLFIALKEIGFMKSEKETNREMY